MVSLLEAIILSIVQGITEWFPISSSGHLVLAQELLGNVEYQTFGFTIYLHFASVLSVVILFGKDIAKLTVLNKKNLSYLIKLAIAIIPAGVVGILLLEQVRNAFSNFLFLGIFFMIMGIFIYSTKYARERKNTLTNSDAVYIGVSQVFALFPGVSRSGMTMGSGLILGLKREEAIKFSFLLAIPIIIGATIVEAKEISLASIPFTILLTSFTITLLISLITIKFLVKTIMNNKFYLFGIYNFILGVLVVLWYVLR
ncbi:undecaprenyl-diphosphate phosphatase [Candidatus Pacearchaeota archaeon]|nr:undecaprenyl-diphosphate phosphatase [Candidatus Pacearchaeota archaeon]